MATALIDDNGVPTKLACLNTDSIQGTNLVNIAINESNDGIKITTSASISFTMQPVDPKDENFKNCWLFEGTDGLTYPAVATSSGLLLIEE